MGAQNFEKLISLYHGIFVYCGIAAILFVVAAIVLFILLKIPQVFSELSGRGAKKAIAEMTEGDTTGSLGASKRVGSDGRRQRRTGKTGTLGTGKLNRRAAAMTEELGETGKMGESRITNPVPPQNAAYNAPGPDMNGPADGNAYSDMGETGVMNDGGAPTDVLDNYGSAPTGVLDSYGSAPTDVLSGGGPAPVQTSGYEDGITMPLGANASAYEAGETMPLGAAGGSGDETMVLGKGQAASGFMVLRSIVEIHTDEVI